MLAHRESCLGQADVCVSGASHLGPSCRKLWSTYSLIFAGALSGGLSPKAAAVAAPRA